MSKTFIGIPVVLLFFVVALLLPLLIADYLLYVNIAKGNHVVIQKVVVTPTPIAMPTATPSATLAPKTILRIATPTTSTVNSTGVK